jgi:signal peptidase II
MTGSRDAPGRSRTIGARAVSVLVGVLALDQLTKWLVVSELGRESERRRVDLWEPHLALEYVENTGAAFGLLRGQGAYLLVLAVVVVGGLIAFLRWTEPTKTMAASIGLLIGGALGNALDRVRLGYVVDYVAVGIWPKFNLADSAITIGVLLFVWTTLRQDALARDAPAANDAVTPSFGGRSSSKPERSC